MTANGYLFLIIGLMLFAWVLDLVVEALNLKHVKEQIPEEFDGWYDSEKYAESQAYLKERTRFGLITGTITLAASLLFIYFGGFGWVDGLARSLGLGLIPTGLAFTAILILLSQLLSLPASLYSTFVIEEKYGFNKTTLKTFFGDMLKGVVLGGIIGGIILSVILWIFNALGPNAWAYCWGALIAIQIVLLYVAPVWIMPLFNKFLPLEEGELKTAIQDYADNQGFALSGIYKMDGSKRSSKSNAYFTGFGKMRRIVLFDTLIEKHTVKELVSVLAHEVGHYKLKHIHKMLGMGILTTGLMFFIMKFFLNEPTLYQAFGVDPTFLFGDASMTPIYAGLVFFGFLFSPISMIIGIFNNMGSRKHEFEADEYAVKTAGDPEAMAIALKKLSVDNLSNLTPHPLKVFLEYTHPPVLDRIKAIRKLG